MKWICSHCQAINPSGAFKCHNCPNTCGDESINKLQIAIDALKEIESGRECSACSCNCHRVASHALTLTKQD